MALLAHWRRHPIQAVTLALGLALATALWSGVQAVNSEARKSYAAAADALGQTSYDRLIGPDITLADFAALRRAGWLVSPVLEGVVPNGLQIVGIDPLSSPPRPGLSGLAESDLDLAAFVSGAGILLASPEDLAAAQSLDVGSVVTVADVPRGTVLTDVTVAQRLLDQTRLSYLLVLPDQPRGLPALSDVTQLDLVRPEDGTDIAQLTASFHLNLTAFGLLSFAVGLFIVQSAIGLAFEQRRGTFRTLRALGVPLGHLLRLLAAELLVFALLAGVVGLVLGYAIAAALLPGVAGTLRGLYGASIDGTLSFDPAWALSALAITLLGTAAAGAQALWRVSQLPLLAPARPRAWALVSGRQIRWQLAASGVMLVCSAGFGIWGGSLISGFACLALLLIGAALALPAALLGLLSAARPLARGALSEWMLADARQQVPALSLALMALLLALSANIGVGTMVGAFRTTFIGWLDQRLVSELYVTARTQDEAKQMLAIVDPQAEAILPIWSEERRVQGQPADVFGIIDHPTYSDHWPLLAASDTPWASLHAQKGALINEQLARRLDLWPGATIDLGDDWVLPVVGVYSDYGNTQAQVIVAKPALDARVKDPVILRYGIRIAPEKVAALRQELQEKLGLARGNVINQAEVKQFSLDVFDQTFVVTAALNVLTLAIAGVAMLTSLLTLAQMRLPQLAPVWATGQSPGRLALFELIRTGLLAALTWALAIPLGLILAWVLLAIINVQAFGWRIPMSVFPTDWLWLGLWALVAALAASLWPVYRLTRLPSAALLRSFASDR